MSLKSWAIGACALSWCAAAIAGGSPTPEYSVTGSVAGPRNVFLWDYASIDGKLRRLFLATFSYGAGKSYVGAISAFDLRSGRVTPFFLKDGLPHKVAIIGGGVAAAADAARHRVIFFNEVTGKEIAGVATGRPVRPDGIGEPDNLLWDRAADLLLAVNHDNGSVVLMDASRHAVVARIEVGGILEAIAAGAGGRAYVNVSNKGAIAVIDLRSRQVVRRIPMGDCKEPTGLAFDRRDQLIISVCSNGIAKFIDPASGSEIASIPVGKGADGVMYDGRRKVVSIAGGDSGTLSVIRLAGRHDIRLTQTLRIPIGTRLGIVDTATGRLYLPSVTYDLKAAPLALTGLPALPPAIPGSFRLLVVAPSN